MRLRSNAKVALISNVPLFAGCSKRELGLVASIADEIAQPAGAVLTVEGKTGREFCILVSGAVEVRQRAKRLRLLSAGDFFGEIALISDSPRTATAVADMDSQLLVLDIADFRGLMARQPDLVKVIETEGVRRLGQIQGEASRAVL